MQPKHKKTRVEIIVRSWRETQGGDESYRGSISTLNGTHAAQFIGLEQLFSRLSAVFRSTLGSEDTQ